MKKTFTIFMLVMFFLSSMINSVKGQLYNTQSFNTATNIAGVSTPGAWYPDRYPPAAFESYTFGAENVLKLGISQNDGLLSRPAAYQTIFYNTQGRNFDLANDVTVVYGSLYIPLDWATKHRRSDLWATAFNSAAPASVTDYPIIGFANTAGNNPVLRYWNEVADSWVTITSTITYNSWYKFKMVLSSGSLTYYVNGIAIATIPSIKGGVSSEYLGNMMLQAYNFNDASLGTAFDATDATYNVYWDNIGSAGGPITTIGTPVEFSCGVYDVPITVKHFNDVGNISLKLNYDATRLDYQNYTLNSSIDAGTIVFTPSAGKFIFSYINTVSNYLADDAALITLRFAVKTPAATATAITLDNTDLANNEYATPEGIEFIKTPSSTYFINGSLTPVRPVVNTTTHLEYCTIQAAIDDPLTANGHTIEVGSGTYNEQVLVNKQLNIKGTGVTKPIINYTGTPALASGKLAAFEVTVPNVTIDRFEFKIDISKLGSAIVASVALPGSVSNLTVQNNDINPYRSNATTVVYGLRNAVNINYGSFRINSSKPVNILVQNNTVSYSFGLDGILSVDDAGFRSGFITDEGTGTFTGNTIQTVSQDIEIRFTNSADNINITNNHINGGGVSYAAPNVTGGTLTISGNTFNGDFGKVYESSLRLRDNIAPNAINTIVNGNTFINHNWGISLENYGTVTVNNNTFTPSSGSTTYNHITVNTKENASSSNTVVQTPIGGIFTNNIFKGSGTTGGTALMFLNHDLDNASYGTFNIGNPSNENMFNTGIARFVAFDNQTGSSNSSIFPIYPSTSTWPTTMACWNQDIDIRSNKFDVGSSLQLPSAMNLVQRNALETALFHKPDASCTGNLIYLDPVHNITLDTYYLTIQAAINAASPNNVIQCAANTYNEAVVIDKSLTLQGANVDKSQQVINGAGLGIKSGITINGGVTNVTIKNLTIQNFTGTNGNSNAGVYGVLGNNNLVLDNVACLSNSNASGFYANGPVSTVLITNSTFSDNGPNARGIVFWNGMKSDITITNNTLSNNVCCGIELSDGNASKVTITGNTINIGTGDNAMGLVGLNQSVGPNLIDNNTITGGGRYGIEIKNPAGGVTVSNNNVSLTTKNADLRDRAGIAVFRRSVGLGNIDVPNGVLVKGNTVTGYSQTLPEEGFGIVIEGTNHTVTGNTISNCNIGIQQQGGGHANANYPAGDGDQGVGKSPDYFGRGNAPFACGNSIVTNTFSSNTTDTRNVLLNSFGLVTNTNSGEYFCNIQASINDAQTLVGHSITVAAGTYAEDILVNKALTILGPKANVSGCDASRGTGEAIIVPATNNVANGIIFNVQASNVTIKGFTIDGDNPGLTSGDVLNETDLNAAMGVSNGTSAVWIDYFTFDNNIVKNIKSKGVYIEGTGPQSSFNYFRNNKFTNIWNEGIQVYNQVHVDIENNCFSALRSGISSHTINTAATSGFVPKISNNTIVIAPAGNASKHYGIWVNHHYTGAADYEVSGNTITADAAIANDFAGIAISTILNNTVLNVSGNIINGNSVGKMGYYLWNTDSHSLTISGGSITGVKQDGVLLTNSGAFLGYGANYMAGNFVKVDNVSINSAGNGVHVLYTASGNGTPVSAEVTNCTNITGGTNGILIDGANAFGNIHENTITNSAVGINVNGTSTTATNGLTISNNTVTRTAQLAGANPTVGVSLTNIFGTKAATISTNIITGPFYGYMLYNLNTTTATTITGGAITGVMQGVASINIDPAGSGAWARSAIGVSDINMSLFAGNYPALPNSNFHAGVYVYTGGSDAAAVITATLDKVSVSGTGNIQGDCAGLYFTDWSTGIGNRQNIKVTECTLTGNLNRGIFVNGKNALVDIGTSTLNGNGFNPIGTGGNDGFGIIARSNANVNIHNCFITNPAGTSKPVTAISTDGATITAVGNHLDNNNNTAMGKLAASSGIPMTATCNWLGSTNPAINAAMIAGPVSFNPWLCLGVDQDLVLAGFQGVACNSGSVAPAVPSNGASTVSGISAATAPTTPTVKDVDGTTNLTPVLVSMVDFPVPVVCEGTRTYTYTYTNCSGISKNWSYTYTVTRSTLSGTLKYNNGSKTAMNKVTLRLLDSDGVKVGDDVITAEETGAYSFPNLCSGAYNIAVIDNKKPVGGINSTDAGAANYWGAHYSSIEMAKFMAGDVSNNSFISSEDAQKIQQYFVFGTLFGRTPWSYWKKGDMVQSNLIPAPIPTAFSIVVTGNVLNYDLYAQCTGDFNGSFIPNNTAKSTYSSLELIAGNNVQVGSNQVFELPLRSASAVEVGAVSMILDIPSDLVEVIGVRIDGSDVPVTYAVKGNELRIGWNSTTPVNIAANGNLLTLQLKTKGAFTAANTIDLKLIQNPLNEMADGNFNTIEGAVLTVDQVKNGLTGIHEPGVNNLSLANYPNPFSESTMVAYEIPAGGKVTLEVHNMLGQLMTTLVDKPQDAGKYSVKLEGSMLQKGIFFVILKLDATGGEQTRTIRLIVN